MIAIIFRRAASADLRQIAAETRRAWGEDQAKRYVGRLRDQIKELREFPLRHPEFGPRPGLRRMNSGRNAVFYVVAEDRVEIIRVVHVASDLERWA
ncbi:MAG: type II toxin-antitoxin system RelE/ParE family toxin [Erythrobacter sp.]